VCMNTVCMNTVCVNTDVMLPPRLYSSCYPNKERLSLRPAGEPALNLPKRICSSVFGGATLDRLCRNRQPCLPFDELALVEPRYRPRVVDNDSEREDFPPTGI
jgi:hypothetical protein